MKKIGFILSFLFVACFIQAQSIPTIIDVNGGKYAFISTPTASPWSGFFQPSTNRVKSIFIEKGFKGALKATTIKDSTSFLWSPDVTLTASFYPLGVGAGTVQALNSAGIGVSYGNYSLINGSAYCNYSINVDFMSQVNLNGASTAGFGGAVSVAVLNKFLRLGVAVIGTNGFSNAHVGPIFGISTSF